MNKDKYSLYDCLTRKKYNWGGKCGRNYYHDNGASVLGVAHLDYVMYDKPERYKDFVSCPQLDDRLGVWILLNQLPKLGVKLDVLLTTDEECINSSARYFYPDKKYNWVVEFDRAGEDIVFYQYKQWSNLFKPYGFKVGQGSYTDIVDLDHLGAMGVNVGIGYHDQHTRYCYADIQETNRQVKKFCQFWQEHKDICYPYKEAIWKDEDYDLCPICGDVLENGFCLTCAYDNMDHVSMDHVSMDHVSMDHRILQI